MFIKQDKTAMKVLSSLFDCAIFETAAVKTFRSGDISTAISMFQMIDLGVKIAKAIICASTRFKVTAAEACTIIEWFAHLEKSEQDYYTLNLIRSIKADLHQQLTNYQSKF